MVRLRRTKPVEINEERIEPELSDFRDMLLDNKFGVKTLCIITSDNPLGRRPSNPKKNPYSNAVIRRYLDEHAFDWIEVLGAYGSLEDSLMIINASFDKCVRLAGMFHQNSFIFATAMKRKDRFSRQGDKPENAYDIEWNVSLWQMSNVADVALKGAKPEYKRIKTVSSITLDDNLTDYFSEYQKNGKKMRFQFPLYDDWARLKGIVYDDSLEDTHSDWVNDPEHSDFVDRVDKSGNPDREEPRGGWRHKYTHPKDQEYYS